MFDINNFRTLIADVDNATTNQQKGLSFELLSIYMFEHLDGVDVTEHDIRMPSEEIDIVLWNAQTEEILRPWDSIILVECKNWSATVGAPILDNFVNKVRRRALTTGIFVAANGVTGGFVRGDGTDPGAVGILRSALQDGVRVIVITMDDIRAITSLNDIRALIKKRYCGLYVHKVL
ncbi:restriction endonuclease [Pseudomonas sp. MIS38]|uniref:restriction endonuclease n=1 Tax=Pseudomonas sp. MIS38 TaxID=91465 RepID=UPI001CA60807|nr:restriction endonuclease [Pseudomonas sp. MIS38]MBY8960847.1 restriction endonuclease [Pseudomonas sp. MIS38]